MWLIKPGKGSLCVDLKGKEFWFTKDGRLCISQGNGRHFFTYSSEDAAIAMQTAIITAIKSGKAYLEPAEAGLERGEHEWADRPIQASIVGWKTQDTPEVTVGNQVNVYVDDMSDQLVETARIIHESQPET